MRIIAGDWRGRPLAAPAGRATRPTSDRAREGLFSMLASRLGSFDGLMVADLFAGSGALGLEALSRGAAHGLFVDSDRAAQDAIRTNLTRLGAAGRATVSGQKVEHAAPPPRAADLILLDPPYGEALAEKALARIAGAAWLAPGGWIALETDGTPFALPPGLNVMAERRFGKALITLLGRAPSA